MTSTAKSRASSQGNDNDQETIKLVEDVKALLDKRIGKNESITDDDIETATFDARCKYDRTIEKWRKDSSIDASTVSDDLIDQSIAYVKEPGEINQILKEIHKRNEEKLEEHRKKKCFCTSIDDIIEPLKTLRSKLKQFPTSKYLFAAVLEIEQDKIDRADRMFFTEARRLLNDSPSYTIEIAHHQVQAIRLMPYEPKDEDEIRTFIKKCPNFEVAYKHLQKLTKERVERREENAASTSPRPHDNFNRSIVGQNIKNDDYDTRSSNNRQAKDDPPYCADDGRTDRHNADQNLDARRNSHQFNRKN